MTDKPAKPDAEKLLPCEEICDCYSLEQPEDEYSLTIKFQADGSGRFHCDECGKPMSPLGMSRTDYLTARDTRPLPTSLQLQEQPEQDQGVSPTGPGSREPDQQAVPALRASIPDAEALVGMMSAWSCTPFTKFHAAYPFFKVDRDRTVADFGLTGDNSLLAATALLFAEYADDLYVQGMSTGTAKTPKAVEGRSPASPVAESDAPMPCSPTSITDAMLDIDEEDELTTVYLLGKYDGRKAAGITDRDGVENARHLLDSLARAEANYRYAHDHFGASDIRTGRAWDKMRLTGDNARKALSPPQDTTDREAK